MYIKRRIIKRGEQKIKLTPEEIKQAYLIQKEIDSNKAIIKAIKEWIKFIDKEKDVKSVINKFNELFDSEYNPIYSQEISKSFESYSEIYMLNDNITIKKLWGSLDKIENKVSHVGIDLCVKIELSRDEESNKEIYLFIESKYQDDSINKLNKFIEEYEEIKLKEIYDNK